MQDKFAVPLNKRVTDKITGERKQVIVQQPRNVVEYNIIRQLLTMLPVSVQDAKKKTGADKVVPMTKNAPPLSIVSIVEKHPLDFKLEGNMIYRAR